jgi:hypothetical protein
LFLLLVLSGQLTCAPLNCGRQAARNFIHFSAGAATGVNPATKKEAVLMFLDGILADTVLYTNLQGRRIIRNRNGNNPGKQKTWKPVDKDELEAFIGLLIVVGAKDHNQFY